MNDSDKRPFYQMLKATMDTYGKELSKDAYHLWWSSLAEISIEQVRQALSEHVKSSPYFPKPSDVITRCKPAKIPPSHRLYKPTPPVEISDEKARENCRKLKEAINATAKTMPGGSYQ